MRKSEMDTQLQKIYDQIPDPGCKGLCHQSCGPIDGNPREIQRLREAGVKMPHIDAAKELAAMRQGGQGYTCPALTKDLRCGVYEIRPFVCRVWGASESLPCPWGCLPESGKLLDAVTTKDLCEQMKAVGSPSPPAMTRQQISDWLASPGAKDRWRKHLEG